VLCIFLNRNEQITSIKLLVCLSPACMHFESTSELGNKHEKKRVVPRVILKTKEINTITRRKRDLFQWRCSCIVHVYATHYPYLPVASCSRCHTLVRVQRSWAFPRFCDKQE
jgi:hypothetical protein